MYINSDIQIKIEIQINRTKSKVYKQVVSIDKQLAKVLDIEIGIVTNYYNNSGLE